MSPQRFDVVREHEETIAQACSFRVIAQDPSVTIDGQVLTADVRIPAEHLEPGPRGARFHVVDYDAATGELLPPAVIEPLADGAPAQPLDLADPGFRAQNVYAIAARTLAMFEGSLGRRVPWAFGGHQLFLVPRAFPEANAFYDPDAGAVLFGHVPGEAETSLSHDIVAHETTHAILDGLRPRFAEPGLPDQPAFHEALGDIVALLSVFSLEDVVARLLADAFRTRRLSRRFMTPEALGETTLFTLAEQLGSGERGSGLRRSVDLPLGASWRTSRAYEEPHRRGEVLVAAVMHAVIAIWSQRLEHLGRQPGPARVAEEGAKAAEHVLRMFIRGIDYMPPVELEYEDVIDSVLTLDEVVAPDDEHHYRDALRGSFAAFDIQPPAEGVVDLSVTPVRYERMNYTLLRSDPDEVHRFIWENGHSFGINRAWRTRVQAVRPSVRVGPDGLIVEEVAADYVQSLEMTAGELTAELAGRGLPAPAGIAPETKVQLWGGGVVIFDQFGRAKFHQTKPLEDWSRQSRRFQYLVSRELRDTSGRFGFSLNTPRGQRFAALHVADERAGEDW
jgi:Thermolysin metallopeptidase, catalytic domain